MLELNHYRVDKLTMCFFNFILVILRHSFPYLHRTPFDKRSSRKASFHRLIWSPFSFM